MAKLDALLVLFFLLALLWFLARRVQKSVSSTETEFLNSVFFGLGAVSFAAFWKGFSITGPTFFDNLLLGLVLVSGTVLVFKNSSILLSHFRSFKKNQIAGLRHIIIQQKILSLIQRAPNLETLLQKAVRILVRNLHYEWGAVWQQDFMSREFLFSGYFGLGTSELQKLNQTDFENWVADVAKSYRKVQSFSLSSENLTPEILWVYSPQSSRRSLHLTCVPLKFKEKIIGAIILAGQNKPEGVSETFLSSSGEILGEAIEHFLVCGRNKKRREYLAALEQISRLVTREPEIETQFMLLVRALKRIIDFHYLSLSILDASGKNFIRYAVGTSGNLLLEKGVNRPVCGMDLEAACSKGEAQIQRDLRGNTTFLEEELLKLCGCNCRLLLPLKGNGKVNGILSLGHKNRDFYNQTEIKWLKPVTAVLGLWLKNKAFQQEFKTWRRNLATTSEISQEVFSGNQLLETMQNLVQRLTSEMKFSLGKIWLLSKDRQHLNLCSLSRIRHGSLNSTEEKVSDLSQLPWHRLALESRKTMLVNQDDPESFMDKSEARVSLSENLSSALLVPLVAENQVLGLLALGEERSWQRRPISYEELTFVSQLAGELALSLKNKALEHKEEKWHKRLAQEAVDERLKGVTEWAKAFLELKFDINNPLTTIVGATELLKMQKNLPAQAEKYINLIEKGSGKLQKKLEQFMAYNQELSGSPEKEQVWEIQADEPVPEEALPMENIK